LAIVVVLTITVQLDVFLLYQKVRGLHQRTPDIALNAPRVQVESGQGYDRHLSPA